MDASINAVIAFIADHKGAALWVALLFAAAETTAVLSLAIPSTAILVAVGAMVATGALNFWPIWIGASIGALIGSSFSYWLGATYGDRILGLWPLRNHPDLAQRGTAAFAKWGPMAILIGHFFGPLRSVVFLLAGMSRMRLAVFMLVNVTGALAWAYLVPKFGEVGGLVLGWLWRLVTGG